jgi:DNA-directed RNA polymerase specialized sigma24 family protein
VLEQAVVPRNAGAWLERVGRNAAIDRWRVETRRRELLRDAAPPEAAPDPESVLLERERRQLVRRAVATLPRPQRRAALARFHAELSDRDAAARLATSTRTPSTAPSPDPTSWSSRAPLTPTSPR